MGVTPAAEPAKKPPRSWKRRLLGMGIRLLLFYLGIVLVMLLLENWLLFPGTKASQDWWGRPDKLVQDVELRSADGTRLHAWWCPQEGATSALLYCHGNGGNLSHRGGAIAELRQALGVSVLIFDYPGYGKSEGSPDEAGCYAAAGAAYDWLTEAQKIAPEQVILYGKSLGGGVAVDLATRRPHRALVLLKAFTSAPDTAAELYPWLPARWLMRNRFDSLGKIGKCSRPVFIAHGTTDTLIPFTHGERLFAAANEPKQFWRMEGVSHNDPISTEFLTRLRRFLDETAPASN